MNRYLQAVLCAALMCCGQVWGGIFGGGGGGNWNAWLKRVTVKSNNHFAVIWTEDGNHEVQVKYPASRCGIGGATSNFSNIGCSQCVAGPNMTLEFNQMILPWADASNALRPGNFLRINIVVYQPGYGNFIKRYYYIFAMNGEAKVSGPYEEDRNNLNPGGSGVTTSGNLTAKDDYGFEVIINEEGKLVLQRI